MSCNSRFGELVCVRMESDKEANGKQFPEFFSPKRTTVCTQTFSRFLAEYHEIWIIFSS